MGNHNLQILIADLNSTWSNYSMYKNSNHYYYFLLRYSHIPICATYATIGTWQRHFGTSWIFAKMTWNPNII